MPRLEPAARAYLRGVGVSQAALARHYFTDGRWHGDACGCPDDRCIGHHHESGDDCLCFPIAVREVLRS